MNALDRPSITPSCDDFGLDMNDCSSCEEPPQWEARRAGM
jgi:hypothetical protein